MNKNTLLNQDYICPIGADGVHFKVAEYMVDPVRETKREKLVQIRTEEASSESAGDKRDEKDDEASAVEKQESDAAGEPVQNDE